MTDEPKSSDLHSVPPDSDTPREARAFVAKTKAIGWLAAAVITGLTGLAGSIVAVTKPRDDSALKAGYVELSGEIKKLSREQGKQHDDIVLLRAYLEGFMRSQPAVSVSAPPPGSTSRPTLVISPIATEPAPKPPPVSPRPEAAAPAAFDEIVK